MDLVRIVNRNTKILTRKGELGLTTRWVFGITSLWRHFCPPSRRSGICVIRIRRLNHDLTNCENSELSRFAACPSWFLHTLSAALFANLKL